mmetsp:Transcript_32895/g.40398  ORF Transcript_32895/g.40398 Transcript_32895/m.40398 type:complete len:365 (+) Transcript_32895:552-1646(+)
MAEGVKLALLRCSPLVPAGLLDPRMEISDVSELNQFFQCSCYYWKDNYRILFQMILRHLSKICTEIDDGEDGSESAELGRVFGDILLRDERRSYGGNGDIHDLAGAASSSSSSSRAKMRRVSMMIRNVSSLHSEKRSRGCCSYYDKFDGECSLFDKSNSDTYYYNDNTLCHPKEENAFLFEAKKTTTPDRETIVNKEQKNDIRLPSRLDRSHNIPNNDERNATSDTPSSSKEHETKQKHSPSPKVAEDDAGTLNEPLDDDGGGDGDGNETILTNDVNDGTKTIKLSRHFQNCEGVTKAARDRLRRADRVLRIINDNFLAVVPKGQYYYDVPRQKMIDDHRELEHQITMLKTKLHACGEVDPMRG